MRDPRNTLSLFIGKGGGERRGISTYRSGPDGILAGLFGPAVGLEVEALIEVVRGSSDGDIVGSLVPPTSTQSGSASVDTGSVPLLTDALFAARHLDRRQKENEIARGVIAVSLIVEKKQSLGKRD